MEISPTLRATLIVLREAIRDELKFEGAKGPEGNPEWITLRAAIAEIVREILTERPSFLEIDLIQMQAIEKGVIPDPDTEESGMKYYRLPDWSFAHWKCGTPIEGRRVSHSVHFQGGHGAGTGEVEYTEVAFCPTCETPPNQSGAPVYIQ